MTAGPDDNRAFRHFLRRVWRDDVAPLLRDRRAGERRQTARVTGKTAAAAGLLLDTVFGLKGRPFARFMTVVGSSLGAMLPDVWDWDWLRERAAPTEREAINERVARRAAALPEAEALALFDLPPSAARDELKQAWREVALRWHPDKAPDAARRPEYHVRFIAYQAAYEQLCRAYDAGRLPHMRSR
ncbi:MAG: J domain-containing protein [Planctomycetota bacterium]